VLGVLVLFLCRMLGMVVLIMLFVFVHKYLPVKLILINPII
jgi:hypothetical protein